MKRIILILVACCSLCAAMAQTPEAIKYQAVARDNSGNALSSASVVFRVSILKGSATGASVYVETNSTTTNQFGLANLEIGNGTLVSGSFSGIDWSAAAYFIKIELSTNAGSTYTLMGTSQLLSVPYALYAKKSLNPGPTGPTGATGITGPSGSQDAWGLHGNGGTSFSSDFLGTTDNSDLFFRINNQAAGFIEYANLNRSTALGYQSLMNEAANISASNAAFGCWALTANKYGFQNAAFGFDALFQNSGGSDNSAFGFNALTVNKLGTYNTAIGSNADVLVDGLVNATALGAYSLVGASNSLTLGGTGNYLVNVGIGTAVPHNLLEVNYSGQQASDTNPFSLNLRSGRGVSDPYTDTFGLNAILFGNSYWNDDGSSGFAYIGASDDGSAGGYISFATTNDNSGTTGTPEEKVRIINNGYVGIYTLLPLFPLDVQNTNTYTISGYGYLNQNGSTGYMGNQQSPGVSIRATGRIVGTEFDAYSDNRIKDILDISNRSDDMNTLAKLEVTDFSYKDKIENGNNPKKGFIAQQVESVFPEAVSRMTNFIPDIYALSSSCIYDPKALSLTVRLDKPHQLKEGDIVKLITSKGNQEAQVDCVISDNEFSVAAWKEPTDKVFVYGRQVNDFRMIDYDRIYTLNVSATQELIQKVTDLEKENSLLRSSKADVSEVDQLKQQINELKELMNQNGIRAAK